MNWDRIESRCNRIAGQAEKRWRKLSDLDAAARCGSPCAGAVRLRCGASSGVAEALSADGQHHADEGWLKAGG